MYCFYSAVRACCNPSGSLSLVHRTKQNTHKTWDLWISAVTGDRGAAAPSAVTHFCMDVQVNLPEICPGTSDHRWTLPLPSNENHLRGTTPPSSRPRPLLPPTSRAETGGREGAPPATQRPPPPARERWLEGRMGGAWKGPPRRGGTSARRRGGFLRSAGYPARGCESAPLPPPSRPGARSSARGPARSHRLLLGLTAALTPLPPSPPGLTAPRLFVVKAVRDAARGHQGPIPAPGSDGRRREEPGMLRLMANCCSWFKRRQEPVR